MCFLYNQLPVLHWILSATTRKTGTKNPAGGEIAESVREGGPMLTFKFTPRLSVFFLSVTVARRTLPDEFEIPREMEPEGWASSGDDGRTGWGQSMRMHAGKRVQRSSWTRVDATRPTLVRCTCDIALTPKYVEMHTLSCLSPQKDIAARSNLGRNQQ